jgi:hypothetical protein
MAAPDVDDLDVASPAMGELEVTWTDVLGTTGRYHIRIRDDDRTIVEQEQESE